MALFLFWQSSIGAELFDQRQNHVQKMFLSESTEPLRQGRRVGGSKEGPRNRRKETKWHLE